MRFIAAQFSALLSDDLWLRNAVTPIRWPDTWSRNYGIPQIAITQPVQANAVLPFCPATHRGIAEKIFLLCLERKNFGGPLDDLV